MRLIDIDKLHVDKQINGKCWISQEQIINAQTVEAVPLSVIENIHKEIRNLSNKMLNGEYIVDRKEVLEIIDRKVNEVKA